MAQRVLLADDHGVVREGLKVLLERAGFQVVAEASDGREALDKAFALRPDVAEIDVTMPLLNGIDVARALRKEGLRTKVILLTFHTERQYVVPALEAGISGYVVKTQASADLVRALHEIGRGRIYVSPAISGDVGEAVRQRKAPNRDPLTRREREVLQLIAEGKSTKEVAGILGVSVKTADTHRTHIMAKLDIHDTAGLVRYAIREGLTSA
jgi:DNA-binding NarL/FixJ family response regulator